MVSAARLHIRRMAPTNANYNYYRRRQRLSPAVARALDLWVTGAVKSKKEAAEAVGISRYTVYLNSRSPAGMKYVESAHSILQERIVDTSVLIERLSRRGIEVIGTLMEDSESDAVRLKAAVDLADRGKETAKTTKIQTENFSLTGRDVAALAEAMVKAATLREKFPEAATGNYIKAETDAPG